MVLATNAGFDSRRRASYRDTRGRVQTTKAPMNVRRAFVALAVLCSSLLPDGAIAAPPCPIGVDAVPGPLGYAPRENDRRCEGFVRAPISSSAAIIGYRMGHIIGEPCGPQDDVCRNDRVRLVVPADDAPLSEAELWMRAQAIAEGIYYRMDARVATGQPFSWPYQRIAGLSLDALAIRAEWVNGGDAAIYAPVRVSGSSGGDGEPVVTLRFAFPVSRALTLLGEDHDDSASWPPRRENRRVVDVPLSTAHCVGLCDFKVSAVRADTGLPAPPQSFRLLVLN